jgi:hypothetical protein
MVISVGVDSCITRAVPIEWPWQGWGEITSHDFIDETRSCKMAPGLHRQEISVSSVYREENSRS